MFYLCDIDGMQDPSSEPSPEQVASVLSRAFTGFLDPLVWSAARAHVSLDELPSLCDTDAMRNIAKRCLAVSRLS